MRGRRPFAPTKQNVKIPKIFGFDVETTGKRNDFLMGSIVDDQGRARIFWDKNEIQREFLKHDYRGAWIVASNLSFDFFTTFHRSDAMKTASLLMKGSDLLLAKLHIKQGKYVRRQRGAKAVTFLDTMNYSKASVKSLGKLIGLSKLEKPKWLGMFPQSDAQRKEIETYNVRDSLISCLAAKKLISGFVDLGASPRITLASTAMSIFTNKYLKDVYWAKDKSILREEMKAYCGGRSEVFERGRLTDFNYYDVNSLYPHVMRQNRFPDPNTLRISSSNRPYYKSFEGVTWCTVHVPEMMYPPLPRKNGSKLLFPVGTFDGWFTNVELRAAEKRGCVVMHVHKSHYCKETCDPFSEYVNDLYALRMAYKEKKDALMEQVCKILLNGLYGKFGQRFDARDNLVTMPQSIEEMAQYSGGVFDPIEGTPYVRVSQDVDPAPFCIPLWSSYVTAYARLHLLDLIEQSKPYYCDTDSIMTKATMPTSKHLGDLKREYVVKEAILVRPKMYALKPYEKKTVIKLKGIGREVIDEKNREEKIVIGWKLFIAFAQGNTAVFDRFCKPKEALKRKKEPGEVIECTKRFSNEDDKRCWPEPFRLDTWQTSLPLDMTPTTQSRTESTPDEKQERYAYPPPS